MSNLKYNNNTIELDVKVVAGALFGRGMYQV
jgi:hypothetical protein